MRILVITNYYPPFEIGGWGQLTHDVVTRLRQRGHDTCVLASNHGSGQTNGHEVDIYRVLHLESPDHIRYHARYAYTQTKREAENRRALVKALITYAPDIIFINGMWNLPHSLARAAEVLMPDRVVYYMASYWPIEADAHTAYWTDAPLHDWRRWPKRMVGTAVRRLFVPGTPRRQLGFPMVLCVSRYLRDLLVSEKGIPLERSHVVYNGIDLEKFPLAAPAANPSILSLLYAGRLSPDKGVHTIIESLGHLVERPLPVQIKLSIVGSGPDDYVTSLHQLADEAGVSAQVHFAGRVSREQMPAVLSAHQGLLFPSVWAEPLARMVQEGMASGLVVIGTPTGGTPEILKDGKNGLMFPAEDAAALADRITRIGQDPPLREKLGQAARQTVAKHFTLDRMVDELLCYFEKMVENEE